MEDNIDVNKIISDFLSHNIEKFIETGKDVLTGASHKIKLKLGSTYSRYLSTIFGKYSKTKTFLFKDEPVYLYEFYEPLSIEVHKKNIDSPKISDIVQNSPYSVITGTAGSGKSIFMRHLLLSSFSWKEKIPVYIELRHLNEPTATLMGNIQSTLELNGFNLGRAYLEKALKEGHFVLLLDGFDELDVSKHKTFCRELSVFIQQYPKNYLIVSSRPDNDLQSIPNFILFKLMPLNSEQACALIEKIPFDSEIKSKFIQALNANLYSKHKSFLSNPLLLSIMLLTYGHSADIPTKLNVFYWQAYEALFQRHDACKGAFQRKRYTKLDIQDFAKVFSLFCLQSYEKRQFEFLTKDAMNYLDKAKRLTSLEYDSGDFLKDALQSVCLLVEDGMQIVFAHRSFQEYFTAYYISNANHEVQKALIEKFSIGVSIDKVFALLYEMSPDIIEKYYLLPNISRLKKELGIKKKVGISHYTKYLKKTFISFEFDSKRVAVGHNDFFSLINFAVRTSHLSKKEYNKRYWGVVFKEYGKILGAPMVIKAKDLSLRHPLVKLLAKKGGTLSLQALQDVLDLEVNLEKKRKAIEKSLYEIILQSRPVQ